MKSLTVAAVLAAFFAAELVLSADISYYKPGLRIKAGFQNYNVTRDFNVEFFFEIALTGAVAGSQNGWVVIEAPKGTRYSERLSMRCPPNDFTFCAFYDEYDYIAGLQVSVPINGISNPVPTDQREIGAIIWSAPAPQDGVAQDYWTYQLFIVNGESLQLTKEEREALQAAKNTLLYNDKFWVSDTDHYSNDVLRGVGDMESDLTADKYYRQRCYQGMGRHYIYELVQRRTCDLTDPWFPLVSSGGQQVHGVGIDIQALIPDPSESSGLRDWIEHQTFAGINAINPDVPRCALDLVSVDNLRTIHMYFISEPWNIQCTDEDDFQALGLSS